MEREKRRVIGRRADHELCHATTCCKKVPPGQLGGYYKIVGGNLVYKRDVSQSINLA